VGKNSLILISGDRHRRRRQIVMPPFHGERLKTYGDLILRITHEVIDQLPLNQPFTARDTMQQISMRVILQAVFGLYGGERYRRLEELLRIRLNMVSEPIAASILFFPILGRDYGKWSPGYKIKQLEMETDRLIYDEIQERRAEGQTDRTDILSLLMAAEDENGEGLTNEELRDELMTLLVAGHETTATALAWSLYWTHRQPDVRDKILAELEEIGADPSPMDLFRLPYLTAVCNETLRIYPVAMLTFPRQVETPVELLGYHLEPGVLIMGCIYLLHHREDLYPNPDQFMPERFLERQYSAFEFMPFGAGSRRCVGAALAQYELKLVLATMLSRCQFELADQKPVMAQRRGITLGPKGGVQMVLKARQSRQSAPVAV
jgi:cytochrome P450